MKSLAIIWSLFAVPFWASAIPLTDTEGRTIEAAVLVIREESVIIRTSNGKEVPINLDRLDARSQKAAREEVAKLEAAKPKGIVVTSTIVKKIDGKFRYFFDIRNHDAKAWEGDVKITLVNKMKGVTNGEETFSTKEPISAGTGRAVYFDAFTGPPSVHGDASVWAFLSDVTPKGGERIEGVAGTISSKFVPAK